MSSPLIATTVLIAVLASTHVNAAAPPAKVVLAVHGGIASAKSHSTAEHQREVRGELQRALEAGQAQLRKPQGTALDAVETAIRVLEDSPHFNAGKGAVFTHDGRNELDASIMDGRTRKAGAVASVTTIKNPITAARAVMEKSKHVLLIGPAAEKYLTGIGVETVDPTYFWTEPRWRQILEIWENEQRQGATSQGATRRQPWSTVGAVALDAEGNLAAGTSTGGIVNKMSGRVGDSPIIGAGTYADNGSCAVSCTGHGEFFIRYVVAHEVAALVKYKHVPLEQAAAEVVLGTLKQAGGEGGLIALDAAGQVAMPHNTEGMYRGYVTADGQIKVMLYED
jgi:L-asparaginase / beta-aspartyl-peptidase